MSANKVRAQPFLKWVGGKRQLLPELRKFVPKHFGTYHEPFVGGGALFFDLAPDRAVLNDKNAELVSCYCAVAHDVEAVIRILRKHVYEKSYYYRMRAKVERIPAAAAARMIYLNRAGFNGLYRVNSKGGFNVPFGRYTNPTLCDADNLRLCAKLLESVDITNVDFAASMAHTRRGDFVYCDPPYVPVSGTADFTNYTKSGFGQIEQERLRDAAADAKRRGVHIVLSNSDTPIVRMLYKRGFQIHRVEARRNVNSKADRRGKVGEVIIT